MVGYNKNSKAYKCIDPKINKVYVSKNVVFNEEDKKESISQIPMIEKTPQIAYPNIPTEEELGITIEEISKESISPQDSHSNSTPQEEEVSPEESRTEEGKKEKRVPKW